MVLAATNRPWDLDEAMLRRLEKRIHVPLPDLAARSELVHLCLRGLSVAQDLDLAWLAEATQGLSGADIHNVCRAAAMAPMRRLLANKSPQEIQALRSPSSGGPGPGESNPTLSRIFIPPVRDFILISSSSPMPHRLRDLLL